jgi:hypothetical protein
MAEMDDSQKPLHMINQRCVYKGCQGDAVWTFWLGIFAICLCGEHGPLGYQLRQTFDKTLDEKLKEGGG